MDIEIDREKFERWIFSKFEQVRVRGDEYTINSIFTQDKKKKLWINPFKNKYHCWKTKNKGDVIKLVRKVNGCSFSEAIRIVGKTQGDVRDFSSSIEKLKQKAVSVYKETSRRATLLPPFFKSFETGKIPNGCSKYYEYLEERKIDGERFGIGYCQNGPYKDGIILPIFDPDGRLVYWTARMLSGKDRYRNPPKDSFELSREDVIWFGKVWPKRANVVFLTEGIFDAMSLQKCDIPAGAILGRELSPQQLHLLMSRKYTIILAFDNDEEGKDAESCISQMILEAGGTILGAVRPEGVKDWNKMLQNEGESFLRSYIPRNIRQLDFRSRIRESLASH